MTRPGLTFALWLAIALFVVLNNAVGDTWIAPTLPVRAVDWYKVLVPLPYAAMLALIHARRTTGPRWFEAALLAALLWPSSTVVVDFLYARFLYGDDPNSFLDRFAFWWGAPYPLLILGLFASPIIAGAALSRHSDRHRASRVASNHPSSRPKPSVASRFKPSVIPTEAERSEAKWRDLLMGATKRRSLHSASLRSG